MFVVYAAALEVGGATILGAALAMLIQSAAQHLCEIVLAFAAGIMLSAAILGLILPSIDLGGVLPAVTGIFAGAAFLTFSDTWVPFIYRFFKKSKDPHIMTESRTKLLLFTAAIAIHNFPEGLAAGVAFGTGNIREAMLIAGGIALQNIPEGIVTVAPLLSAGICPRKALLCGISTGIIEIIGTILGYYSVALVSSVLPFSLAFAGGAMLYVIEDDMIPEIHSSNSVKIATYAFLFGFCVMMISDILLS